MGLGLVLLMLSPAKSAMEDLGDTLDDEELRAFRFLTFAASQGVVDGCQMD